MHRELHGCVRACGGYCEHGDHEELIGWKPHRLETFKDDRSGTHLRKSFILNWKICYFYQNLENPGYLLE